MSSSSSSSSPAAASSSAAPVQIIEDCGGVLQLLSDGTVTRSPEDHMLPAPTIPSDFPVQWKDVVYDATHNLRLRMYRPYAAGAEKLPVLVYFHGGGFCIGSFELLNFHAFGLRLAAELPAVVLSVGYRLAPEHRLPAAFDDTNTLLSWLRPQAVAAAEGAGAEPWLAESADFSRVFVSGDSAGANIAHHVAFRLASEQPVLEPVHVAGFVLFWPFFGGVERTASEAACPPDGVLTLETCDQMWRLALPVGATRAHPAANPFGPDSPALDRIALPPVLVASGAHDLLHDRIVDYVARLKAMGKPVELVEFKAEGHGFSIVDPFGEATNELLRVVKRFVHGSDVSS